MRTCKIENCKNKYRRNGFCSKHSSRVRRHGDPNKLNYFWKHPSELARKEAMKASQKRYDNTDKGRAVNVLKRQRRRHLSADEVTLSYEQIQLINDTFQNRCFSCCSTKDLTLDHNYPLALGGILELANCVLLCRTCNGRKADLLPEEFYYQDQLDALKILLPEAQDLSEKQ